MKTPAKKSPAKKSPAKKPPAKKSPAKKSPAKKPPAKKSPAKKSPAKKSPAKKSPAKKSPAKKSPAKKTSAHRVTVRSFNSPNYVSTVDGVKYDAMRRALLKVLPLNAPGLTQNEMFTSVLAHLPQEIFPNGDKAPWWVKCVQLDLEARREMIRDVGKPIRWRRLPTL